MGKFFDIIRKFIIYTKDKLVFKILFSILFGFSVFFVIFLFSNCDWIVTQIDRFNNGDHEFLPWLCIFGFRISIYIFYPFIVGLFLFLFLKYILKMELFNFYTFLLASFNKFFVGLTIIAFFVRFSFIDEIFLLERGFLSQLDIIITTGGIIFTSLFNKKEKNLFI